jgi:hypothetical protein
MNASLITVLKVASCFEIIYTEFRPVAITFWEEYVERSEAASSFRTLTHISEAAIVLAAEKLMVHDAVKDDLT